VMNFVVSGNSRLAVHFADSKSVPDLSSRSDLIRQRMAHPVRKPSLNVDVCVR